MDPARLDHAQIRHAMEAFGRFTAAAEREDLSSALRPALDKYHAGLFKLVVVGEEKRGKSSFVNALLGQSDLVPVGTEPMTSVVYKLVFGPVTRYRVFFLPRDPDAVEASRPAPVWVTAQEVGGYGTEAGNPNNAKGVDFIAVEHPHPLLEAGLAIVDLPGLGGLKREHALITRRYLPNADAAFFVVDSTISALTAKEVETFELLRQFVDEVIVVQTKIDAVDPLQWKAWRDRNIEIIETKLGIARADLPYFTISNKDKHRSDRTGLSDDLEDSGYLPLLQLLQQELIPSARDRLALPVVRIMIEKILEVSRPLKNRVAVLAANSRNDLAQITQEVQAAQTTFAQWQQEQLPATLSEFNHRFDNLYRDGMGHLQSSLDASPHGAVVGRLMDEIESRAHSVQDVVDLANATNDLVVAGCGRLLDEVSADFDRRSLAIYADAADAIGRATAPLVIERDPVSDEPVFIRLAPQVRSSTWEMVTQGRMGALSGGAIAGLAASMFFPPLGLTVAVVSILGALFGGHRSISAARERQKEQALQQLRAMLMDTVRRLLQQSVRHFERHSNQIKHDMLLSLNTMVKDRVRGDKETIEAIRSKQRQTQKETSLQIQATRELLDLGDIVLEAFQKAGVRSGEFA